MAIRVAVYDDSLERRESLKYLIEMYEDIQFVGGFENCTHVEQDMEATKPEVVLMDIEMPEANGIEGVKRIKSKFPDIIVLMQTVYEDDENLFDSVKAGASGYLLKKDSPEKIISSIREALEGGAPMSPQMASRILRFFQQQPSVTNQYALTEREKNILSLLVDGLSYKMIATKENISFHTVNSHVRKIYEKLHVHSMGEAVSKALREGLV